MMTRQRRKKTKYRKKTNYTNYVMIDCCYCPLLSQPPKKIQLTSSLVPLDSGSPLCMPRQISLSSSPPPIPSTQCTFPLWCPRPHTPLFAQDREINLIKQQGRVSPPPTKLYAAAWDKLTYFYSNVWCSAARVLLDKTPEFFAKITAGSTCIEMSGSFMLPCLEAAATLGGPLGVAFCGSLFAAICAAGVVLSQKGAKVTAESIKYLIGCHGLDPLSQHKPPGMGGCRADRDCTSGKCSAEHFYGRWYCCPGEGRDAKGHTTYTGGHCTHKCIDAAGHKTVCIADDNGKFWNRVLSQSQVQFPWSDEPADIKRVLEKWAEIAAAVAAEER